MWEQLWTNHNYWSWDSWCFTGSDWGRELKKFENWFRHTNRWFRAGARVSLRWVRVRVKVSKKVSQNFPARFDVKLSARVSRLCRTIAWEPLWTVWRLQSLQSCLYLLNLTCWRLLSPKPDVAGAPSPKHDVLETLPLPPLRSLFADNHGRWTACRTRRARGPGFNSRSRHLFTSRLFIFHIFRIFSKFYISGVDIGRCIRQLNCNSCFQLKNLEIPLLPIQPCSRSIS